MENQIVENPVVETGVKKDLTYGELSVSRVFESQYQKEGTLTAELKQVVTTTSTYPAKRVGNSLQDNIFGLEEFNFENSIYENKETRVAWIDVPEGMSREAVIEKLKAFPSARIYRILSNKPILADSDRYAISNPELNATLEGYAESQIVRYPKGNDKEGQITVDPNGKPQYRRVAFASHGKSDVDARTSALDDFYISPALKDELDAQNSASQNFTSMENQTL